MAANLISIFDAMQKFFERQVDIIEWVTAALEEERDFHMYDGSIKLIGWCLLHEGEFAVKLSQY
jgi:hypothetical protein